MLPPSVQKPPRRRTSRLGLIAAVSTLAFVGYSAYDSGFSTGLRASVRRAATSVFGDDLDRDVQTYGEQVQALGSTAGGGECFPIHVRDADKIGILYLHCSDAAYAKDGESVDLSENFPVPVGIARRYNFWRRIYSLWGKDQYVMHSSEYPELVVEAFDVSRVGEDVGAVRREIMVKKAAKGERDRYSRLLLAMYKNRKDESKFTPAMQRMARVMAHIKAPDKYLIASRTLRLQRGQRDFIANGLTVGPRYLPSIEAEFKEQGIPVEITRLAFVESSFNLKAHSKVGASGVYQLMPATGRQYLKVNGIVDERNDPIKASRAAAKLLKLYYGMTGSWPLAITGYNHGVNGIRRAVQRVGSNDIVDLINRYDGNAFGFASKNFYASFLGVYATLKDADRIFPEVPKVAPLAFLTVRLDRAMTLSALKKKYGVSKDDVAALNPDISAGTIRYSGELPRGYVLKIPAKAAETTAAKQTTPNA
jgi:membrane-bound lytic murein transglycosylase D